MSELTGPRGVGVRAALGVLLLVAAGVAGGEALATAAKGSSGSFMLTGRGRCRR